MIPMRLTEPFAAPFFDYPLTQHANEKVAAHELGRRLAADQLVVDLCRLLRQPFQRDHLRPDLDISKLQGATIAAGQKIRLSSPSTSTSGVIAVAQANRDRSGLGDVSTIPTAPTKRRAH